MTRLVYLVSLVVLLGYIFIEELVCKILSINILGKSATRLSKIAIRGAITEHAVCWGRLSKSIR